MYVILGKYCYTCISIYKPICTHQRQLYPIRPSEYQVYFIWGVRLCSLNPLGWLQNPVWLTTYYFHYTEIKWALWPLISPVMQTVLSCDVIMENTSVALKLSLNDWYDTTIIWLYPCHCCNPKENGWIVQTDRTITAQSTTKLFGYSMGYIIFLYSLRTCRAPGNTAQHPHWFWWQIW